MTLNVLIDSYIRHRQSFGERGGKNTGYILRQFNRFAGENFPVENLTKDTILRFLYGKTGKITASWFCKHTVLKGFFNYTAARGYISTILLPEDLPRRPAKFIPFIYSDDELKRMFTAAYIIHRKKIIRTDPDMVRTVLILTYALGLRLGETLAIRLADIDLDEKTIIVRQSKFYKSRMLTFNERIGEIIGSYLKRYVGSGKVSKTDSYLFLGEKGNPLAKSVVESIFSKIRIETGIKRDDGAVYQPRIHDLRHTFAVNRLVSWYEQGEDVQRLLPFLSTYLGHQSLNHTSVYLSMTDKLLGEANLRFENFVKIEKP